MSKTETILETEGEFYFMGDHCQTITADLNLGYDDWKEANFLIPTRWLETVNSADDVCKLKVEKVDGALVITISPLEDTTEYWEKQK